MKKIEKKDLARIYEGNVRIRNAKEWEAFAKKKYKEITGSIYMQGCTGLTSVTFPKEITGSIYMDDKCSEELLSVRHKQISYVLNGVYFNLPLFDKVRKAEFSAQEVFAIPNTEQRRVAYERMDKIKMRDLPGFNVLDEVMDDGYGHPMRIVSFSMSGFDTPFYYLNCHCPSTGREYYLETREKTCASAKGGSFGDTTIVFDAEY